ncbi:MAG: PadR family transcriptional regulator [Anaerolineae bacterium]|nr:PadR family transcriptional regulator [Anaerolineae bacterium]
MSHRYLILGLLTDNPMTGYDIKKHVNSALGAATQASYGTLYPTLHKLLAERLVDVQEVLQRGRPSKKVYRITEQGKRDLQRWLKQPAAADQVRREFLLKLYLARNLPAKDVLALVANRREETEAMLTTLQSEKRSITDPQEGWVMDYALSVCQAEINWLKQVESQIAAV